MIKLKVVIYLRLSREDGDDYESTSIGNQRKLLHEYAEKNNMEIVDEYVDDNYTGYNFNRPDFQRLQNDLNNDKVHIILAKDLSRIGRKNSLVQLFLDNIYEDGKRVITVSDNYDTNNEQARNIAGVLTWSNELYVKDISRKVIDAVRSMQKEGKFISNVPYGYILDEHKKGVYHIDPIAAPYVIEIFDMYLNGMGYTKIAINLSMRNVPTATMLAKQRIESRGETYKGKVAYQWAARTVKMILKNNFYTGVLTLGKTKLRSIKGKKIKQPEELMHVFENAHEPLIDKKTFQLVQDKMLERTLEDYRGIRIQKRPNIFAGVLWCADCGHKLTSTGKHMNTRYVCSTYNRGGSFYCKSHGISESDIKEPLLMFLSSCRDNLLEASKDLDKLLNKRLKNNNSNVPELENTLARLENEVQTLITQKMREVMNNPTMADLIDETYSKMINEKYIEIKSIKTVISDQKTELVKDKDIYESVGIALKIFNDILASGELTKKQIATIVDRIIVHDDGGLDIFLKGNLHDICTNYIQFKYCDKYKIAENIIKYVEINPNKIIPTVAHNYVKQNGSKIGYPNFKKILKILVDGGQLIDNRNQKQGYKLATDLETFKDFCLNHIVGASTPPSSHNSVTLDIIMNIHKWITNMNSKPKKMLF